MHCRAYYYCSKSRSFQPWLEGSSVELSQGGQRAQEMIEEKIEKFSSPGSLPIVLWGHGWGQDHRIFLPLVEAVQSPALHVAFDFPGFGLAPEPPTAWSTLDYAQDIQAWIEKYLPSSYGPITWVGYSFGVRVGLQLAHLSQVKSLARVSASNSLIDRAVLIAGPGIKHRSWRESFRLKGKVFIYKLVKWLFLRWWSYWMPSSPMHERIRRYFGSLDYNNCSSAMRETFIKVVSEDFSTLAASLRQEILLIYGREDRAAPAAVGIKYHQLIKTSQLVIIDRADHGDLLQRMLPQVQMHLNRFLAR